MCVVSVYGVKLVVSACGLSMCIHVCVSKVYVYVQCVYVCGKTVHVCVPSLYVWSKWVFVCGLIVCMYVCKYVCVWPMREYVGYVFVYPSVCVVTVYAW